MIQKILLLVGLLMLSELSYSLKKIVPEKLPPGTPWRLNPHSLGYKMAMSVEDKLSNIDPVVREPKMSMSIDDIIKSKGNRETLMAEILGYSPSQGADQESLSSLNPSIKKLTIDSIPPALPAIEIMKKFDASQYQEAEDPVEFLGPQASQDLKQIAVETLRELIECLETQKEKIHEMDPSGESNFKVAYDLAQEKLPKMQSPDYLLSSKDFGYFVWSYGAYLEKCNRIRSAN